MGSGDGALKEQNIRTLLRDTDTVIFDIGNVLLDYDWRSYLQGFHFSPPMYPGVLQRLSFSAKTGKEGTEGGLLRSSGKPFFLKMHPAVKKRYRQFLNTSPV